MAEDNVTIDDTVESEAVAPEEAIEAVEEAPEADVEVAEAPEEVVAEPVAPVLVEDVRHKGWDGWTVQKGRLPSDIDLPKVNAVTESQLPNAEKFLVNGGHADSALILVARAAE
jgi:hypothetical protein